MIILHWALIWDIFDQFRKKIFLEVRDFYNKSSLHRFSLLLRRKGDKAREIRLVEKNVHLQVVLISFSF